MLACQAKASKKKRIGIASIMSIRGAKSAKAVCNLLNKNVCININWTIFYFSIHI